MMRWIPLDLLPRLEKLISRQIDCGSWAQRRDAMAVALGMHGLRVGEVCRAEANELFASAGTLYVPPFKRGNARRIKLHTSLVAALLEWRCEEQNSLLLYTRVGRRVHRTQFERAARRLIYSAIGEPLKFHALRHTFAMRVLAETSDMSLVQQLLGHKSISSTEVYAQSLATVPDACLVKITRTECEPMTQRLKIYRGA